VNILITFIYIHNPSQSNSPKSWRSLDLEPNQRPPFKTQRSSSMPTPKTQKTIVEDGSKQHSPTGPLGERSTRGSVSNENNILLDPDVLTDYPTQALLLTVLVSIEWGALQIRVLIRAV
jgi:neurofibromin 1